MARGPGYCLHKPTGQAYVRFNGKLHYFGPHGSAASKTKFNQLKAEYYANGAAPKYAPNLDGPVVADICLAYLDHAEQYYSQSEFNNLGIAIKPLSELYATLPANRFSVLEFRTIRDW